MRVCRGAQGPLLTHRGDLDGKEVQKGAGIGTCMADSRGCTVGANAALESNCTPIELTL